MKTRALSFLFIFLLLSSTVSAFTPPSWFKNGTYVTYAILPGRGRYKGYPNIIFYLPGKFSQENLNALITALENSSKACQKIIPEIKNPNYTHYLTGLTIYGPVFVTFNITNVTNSTATIIVTLRMANASLTPYCFIPTLTLHGALFLNLTDGYYYVNGTRIGRPSFFVLPYSLPSGGDELYRASILRKYGFIIGGDLTVRNVSFTKNRLVHTFVKTFYPPLIKVKSNRQLILHQKEGYLSMSICIDSIYDLGTGIAVGMSFPYPELYALGMVGGNDFNHYSAELNDKIDFSKEFWPYGFVLYKTNIKFPKEETGRAPDTVLKYYLVLGLLLLAIAGVLRFREVRK
ncbi:hypothetical protein [Thermococcus henrietii]|uniref:hypothetical protein n=1 Tax=Thermococcus henrietii TaxID=2016361 RepID=UPI000C069824|nr:hypothetical protein [Thermococcus henrietii]